LARISSRSQGGLRKIREYTELYRKSSRPLSGFARLTRAARTAGQPVYNIRDPDSGRLSRRAALRQQHFVLDGEVVVLRPDGLSDFDAPASRMHDKHAQFYAFDMLAGDGEDIRALPLSLRKAGLTQLLSDPVDGMFIAEYERGEIGNVLFRVACNMGLEGTVSKHLDRPYGAGRCKHWVKVKNLASGV
jgi:hypothetical protein